jgi:hypothetical protein
MYSNIMKLNSSKLKYTFKGNMEPLSVVLISSDHETYKNLQVKGKHQTESLPLSQVTSAQMICHLLDPHSKNEK